MDYLWAIANGAKDYINYMELFWWLNIHMDGLDGRGEIKHGLKQLHSTCIVPFYMLVSNLTPTIQPCPLAAREGTLAPFVFIC